MVRKSDIIRVWMMVMPLLLIGACHRQTENTIVEIPAAAEIQGLHAPWDGLDDETHFSCHLSRNEFHFEFDVIDTTLVMKSDFKEEKDVEPEDRVELFFCPTDDMAKYWCAEMDPLGRVLDYSSQYYRKMDYGWNFKSLKLDHRLTDDGYHLEGSISLDELKELGIDFEKGCHMGVFRADYKGEEDVNWYSHVATDDPSPDFHKPHMLFFAKKSEKK